MSTLKNKQPDKATGFNCPIQSVINSCPNKEYAKRAKAEHAALEALAEAGKLCRAVLNARGGFTAQEKREATKQFDVAQANLAATREQKGGV